MASIDEFKQEKKKYEEKEQSLISKREEYEKQLKDAKNDKEKEIWYMKKIHDIDAQLVDENKKRKMGEENEKELSRRLLPLHFYQTTPSFAEIKENWFDRQYTQLGTDIENILTEMTNHTSSIDLNSLPYILPHGESILLSAYLIYHPFINVALKIGINDYIFATNKAEKSTATSMTQSGKRPDSYLNYKSLLIFQGEVKDEDSKIKTAKKELREKMNSLDPYYYNGLPILFCCASGHSTIKLYAMDLLNKNMPFELHEITSVSVHGDKIRFLCYVFIMFRVIFSFNINEVEHYLGEVISNDSSIITFESNSVSKIPKHSLAPDALYEILSKKTTTITYPK